MIVSLTMVPSEKQKNKVRSCKTEKKSDYVRQKKDLCETELLYIVGHLFHRCLGW